MTEKNFIELNDEALDQIAGGTAIINANAGVVCFSTTQAVYKYKNCTGRQVRNLCEDLIGKYATEAEFDAACVSALKAKGWI